MKMEKRFRKQKVRTCSMCSPKTVMQKSKHDLSQYTIDSNNGVICNQCHRFTCSSCLAKIVGAIPASHHDLWCKKVLGYLGNSSLLSTSFLGHCCELKVERKIVKDEEIGKMKSYSDLSNKLEGRKLSDGDLIIPEFGLLLQTSFTSVDVHALAPDQSTQHSGAWHSTITVEQALEFEEMKLEAKPFPVQDMHSSFTIMLGLPWAPGTKEKVSALMGWCGFSNYVINMSCVAVQCRGF